MLMPLLTPPLSLSFVLIDPLLLPMVSHPRVC